jgi:hypothetical protein
VLSPTRLEWLAGTIAALVVVVGVVLFFVFWYF